MLQTIQMVPMKNVLDKIWIISSQLGFNSIGLWENDKLTDWWIMNVSKNYVNDFSHDRPKWWPFAFVKAYLKLTDRETFEWFKDNFWIVWSASERKISHKEIKKWLKIQYHWNW